MGETAAIGWPNTILGGATAIIGYYDDIIFGLLIDI